MTTDQPTLAVTLKPCPFCGGVGDIESQPSYSQAANSYNRYRGWCDHCGYGLDWHSYEPDATTAWNTRTNSEPRPAGDLREAFQAGWEANMRAYSTRNDVHAAWAVYAATHSPAPMAGEVVVPAEPTEAMLDAVWHQTGESTEMRSRVHASFRRYWSAMIAAAHPSTQEGCRG